MRKNGFINDLWLNGGPFIGQNRSHAVVTVEKDFFLHEANVSGKYFSNANNEFHRKHRNPVRWFQSSDNLQVETVVPNVSKISIDRDIKQDAAACDITILNVKMKDNEDSLSAAQTVGDTFGDPGYYTFNRGHVRAARDRWSHEMNEWHRVLQPGALIRTYEGYGGHSKSLDQCLVDGNLMQSGTWIVDKISINSSGDLNLSCRDTASLLIDQIMYPPLMPNFCYPTQFQNFSETDFNYRDVSSIVVLICLWAGFWLKDDRNLPKIFGNIEQTGFTPDSPIGADFFDKRTCIDVINELKNYVGYCTWVDQEGAFHFESKNMWEKGNFLYSGQKVNDVLQIDERRNLLSYSVDVTKSADRSDIYVSASNPQLNLPGTRFVKHHWNPAQPGEAFGTYLRGMNVPMLIAANIDMPLSQMNIMAQLVHLWLWFSRRTASATVPGNPCIDINDQVKIWERTTADNFHHYVTGVRSANDLTTGVYTMDLSTHWLGTNDDWAIVTDGEWNIQYSEEKATLSADAFGANRGNKEVNRKGSS